MARVVLDRRIQFMRAPFIDDGLQNRRGDYAAHGSPVWASKQTVSDAERFASAIITEQAELYFQVRWSQFTAGILHTDRLNCDGVSYAITGLEEIGHRNRIGIAAARITT